MSSLKAALEEALKQYNSKKFFRRSQASRQADCEFLQAVINALSDPIDLVVERQVSYCLQAYFIGIRSIQTTIQNLQKVLPSISPVQLLQAYQPFFKTGSEHYYAYNRRGGSRFEKTLTTAMRTYFASKSADAFGKMPEGSYQTFLTALTKFDLAILAPSPEKKDAIYQKRYEKNKDNMRLGKIPYQGAIREYQFEYTNSMIAQSVLWHWVLLGEHDRPGAKFFKFKRNSENQIYHFLFAMIEWIVNLWIRLCHWIKHFFEDPPLLEEKYLEPLKNISTKGFHWAVFKNSLYKAGYSEKMVDILDEAYQDQIKTFERKRQIALKLFGKTDSPDKIMLCVHGWLHSSEFAYPLANYVIDNESSTLVVAYDHYGFGHDQHTHNHALNLGFILIELDQVVQHISAQYPNASIELVGHSMGAALAGIFTRYFDSSSKVSLTHALTPAVATTYQRIYDLKKMLSSKVDQAQVMIEQGMSPGSKISYYRLNPIPAKQVFGIMRLMLFAYRAFVGSEADYRFYFSAYDFCIHWQDGADLQKAKEAKDKDRETIPPSLSTSKSFFHFFAGHHLPLNGNCGQALAQFICDPDNRSSNSGCV